ncbi:unnamed protein product [Lupinus luteus]|uniref:Uncharacterized protein n=1 Tax=Lupinus luteus TaxID=3873 RepID=A0AAV1VR93_LUPLU
METQASSAMEDQTLTEHIYGRQVSHPSIERVQPFIFGKVNLDNVSLSIVTQAKLAKKVFTLVFAIVAPLVPKGARKRVFMLKKVSGIGILSINGDASD